MRRKNGWNELTDFRRVDRVNVGRNLTEHFDFHCLVATLLVRMLRRKYPDKKKYPIYTEARDENDNFPDVWMRIKNDIYIWEIQDNMSQKWIKDITEKHKEVNLIIVPLKHLNNIDLNELKEQIKEYLI